MVQIVIRPEDKWDADSLAERICKGASMLWDVEMSGGLTVKHAEPLERLRYLADCYQVAIWRHEEWQAASLFDEETAA